MMGEFRYVGIGALQARAMKACKRAVEQSAEHLVGEAMPLTRVDTGTERAGIHATDATIYANSVIARVQTGGASSEYDFFQHEGTKYMSGTHFISIPLIENRPFYIEAMRRAAKAVF